MTIGNPISHGIYIAVARYFRFFARIARKRWHPTTIAVTGSVGKTTMLNIIEAQLGTDAHYTHGANSVFGLSFEMLGLGSVYGSKLRWLYLFLVAPIRAFTVKHAEKYYVVEIDAYSHKMTDFIASWIRPDITLWVSLGRSHAAGFESMVGRGRGKFATVDKAIAYEFAAVARRTTGSVIIDADNELMVKSVSESDVTAKIVKVSMSDITDYRVTVNRTAFAVSKQIYKFAEPMPPELAIQLAMLGALMRSLDRPVKYDLTKMPVPPGRNNYLRGKDGIDLIDSSYNAHLISMKSILNMYAQIRHAHKWVVLGDMIEQGSVEAEEHEALAKYLLGQKYERIILVGRRMKKYVYPELAAAGRPVEAFEGPKAALEYIELNTAGGESILFKGSQYLDWIVAKLLADPSDVAKLSHHDAKSLARRKKLGLV